MTKAVATVTDHQKIPQTQLLQNKFLVLYMKKMYLFGKNQDKLSGTCPSQNNTLLEPFSECSNS